MGIGPDVVCLHRAVWVGMSSIELAASGAASMFAKEGLFVKHQGREPFLFSIFCSAGAGGGWRFGGSGEVVFLLAPA